MKQLLLSHAQTYPQMQIEDFVKLIYQSCLGCGHLIADPARSLQRLQEEAAAAISRPGPAFEPLGHGYCRLHLGAVSPVLLSLETLNRMFVYSASQPAAGIQDLSRDLALLEDMIHRRQLPPDPEKSSRFLAQYRQDQFPALHHSAVFSQTYRPAYRVLQQSCRDYWDVICAVDQLLRRKRRAVIAIDGGSGTGKSSLAQMLAQIFSASVIHMDDFFLQDFQRTENRLAEPGGNIDYERFLAQVVPHLGEPGAFRYGVFDCSIRQLSGGRDVEDCPLQIVEGVYSHHPKWRDRFDWTVFLTAPLQTRLQRIQQRSGALAERFRQDWIPKEDQYFSAFSIPEKASLVVDTGSFSSLSRR